MVAAILSAVPLGLWLAVSALSRDESENTAELLLVRFGRVALVSSSMLAAAGAGLLVFTGSLGAYFEGAGTPPDLRAHFFFTKAGVFFCLMPGVSLSAIWALEGLLRLPSGLGKHRWLKRAFEDLS